MTLSDLCTRLGTNFSIETHERSEKVTGLLHYYSIILLFGTFLFGIAQSMLEPRPNEVNWANSVSILWSSNNPNLFSALAWSSVALIAGCLAGILGLSLHILFYYNGYRNYITNGFFIDSSLSIMSGILYFAFIMLKINNRTWLNDVISITIVLAIAGILLFEILNWIVNVSLEVRIKRFYHNISQIPYLKWMILAINGKK